MTVLLKISGCVLLLVIMMGGARAQRPEPPPFVSAEHRAILKRWLMQRPQLRVASDEACGRCEQELANQRRLSGEDYHPYYAVGDFNGDGKKDFAVALIELEENAEGRIEQKFAVAVFNAPFRGRNVKPAFFKDELNLRDGGLFFGPSDHRLSIGLFTNDQRLTLVPRGRGYIAQ